MYIISFLHVIRRYDVESALWTEEMRVEKYVKLSVCFCFLLFPMSPPLSLGVAVPTQLADAEIPTLSGHTQSSYNI